MKQHITKEQLKELSDGAKQRLNEWCNSTCQPMTGGCWVSLEYPSSKDGVKWIGLPILSIGQMLEYLAERESDHFYGLSRGGQGSFFVVWDSTDERFTMNTRSAGDLRGGSPITHIRYREGDELVDTLWFVMSTVLESEQTSEETKGGANG